MIERPYANFDSDYIWQHPGRFEGLTAYGFAFLSQDMDALQRTVDIRLNNPTGNIAGFKPMSVLLLTFGHYDKLYSLVPEFRKRGYSTYQEVATWVFCYATKDVPGVVKRGSVFVFTPYLYVDQGFPMTGGREIYGLSKKLGDIQMPTGAAQPIACELKTMGWTQYGPNNAAQSITVAKVSPDGGTFKELAQDWTSLRHGIEAVGAKFARHPLASLRDIAGDLILDVEIAADLLLDITQQVVPVVSFKQSRDACRPLMASFQSMLRTDMKMLSVGGGLLAGTHRVSLPTNDSDPVAADLGVPTSFDATVGFRLTMAAETQVSSALWP